MGFFCLNECFWGAMGSLGVERSLLAGAQCLAMMVTLRLCGFLSVTVSVALPVKVSRFLGFEHLSKLYLVLIKENQELV